MDEINLVQETKAPGEISILDILATLMRHKRFIVTSTLGMSVLVVLYSMVSLLLPSDKSYLPNYYEPTAMVLVSDNSGGGLGGALAASNLSSLASLAGMSAGGNSNGNLAVLIIKSNTTIDELNREFNFTSRYRIKKSIKTETRKAVLKKLSAAYSEKTNTVSITFRDSDPVFAQKVVNRTVEILDRRFASLGGNKALLQKAQLEGKLADVQAQISNLEERVKTFTAQHGIINVEAMATEQVTVLAKLRSEIILKDIEVANYEQFSRIDDPVIRRLRSERDSIQLKISEVERGGSVLPSQKEIPKLAFEYAGLQRDLAVQMEIFKILTQQYELAKLSVEGQDPAFQVLELAEIPDKKAGPSRGMLCIAVALASFILSAVASLAIEAFSRLVVDPEILAKFKGK